MHLLVPPLPLQVLPVQVVMWVLPPVVVVADQVAPLQPAAGTDRSTERSKLAMLGLCSAAVPALLHLITV